MKKFPVHCETPRVPDLTLNQIKEELRVEQAMILDKLILEYWRREFLKANYGEEHAAGWGEG